MIPIKIGAEWNLKKQKLIEDASAFLQVDAPMQPQTFLVGVSGVYLLIG